MNLGIDGRIALVTGGAHGIGAGIVKALSAEGVQVVFTSRKQHVDKRAIQWHPGDEAGKLVLMIRDRFDGNGPDILVNNNGHTLGITDPHCTVDDWWAVLALNLIGAIGVSTACIPHMRQKSWGRVINITSIAGLENSGPVTYCTAKAALTAYTHSMGRVLATESPDVVMCGIAPGVINTEGGHWDNAAHTEKYLRERVPTKRFQTIDEIAPLVAFYCSQHASACHGAIIAADQGQSRHYAPQTYL